MEKIRAMLIVVGIVCGSYAQAQNSNKHFIKLETARENSRQNVQNILRNNLQMNSSEEMKVLKTEQDNLGFEHQKFQHYYKGIKVEGSTYTIHYKNSVPTHMTGNYREIDEIQTTAEIMDNNALELAKASTLAKKFAWETDAAQVLAPEMEVPKGELVIVQNTANGYKSRLAYKYHIIAMDPFVNAYVYVDAVSGEIVRYNSVIKHADATGSADTRYSGTQSITTDSNAGSFRLRDYSRGDGVLTFDATTSTNYNLMTGAPNNASEYTDNNNDWTSSEFNNADKDNAALDAHFAAEATYDFFQNSFGRNSFDGSGAAITSYVNTDIEDVFNYPPGFNDNAFWTGFVMVYGKGNSLDPLTTVDITAHEIGHAYCTGTADLVYEKESGAMNEGLSDIWGACVEFYTNQTYGTNKDIWNLGTEIGQTFRSMSDPKAFGDPDTYGGTNWISQNCNPSSANDYCGVHTNSGVTNHWFYVLAEGETASNDLGDAYSVTGIGVTDAAALTWRTESVYLTTSSDYADFRLFSIQSAVELFGSGSAQEIAVTNSWYAVGVGAEYVTTCALAAPSNLTSSNVGDNGFTLSWNPVTGAASYTVTVGSTSSTVTGTSFVATALLSGTQYSALVSANCSTGGSGASSTTLVTTTGTLPIEYCDSNGNNTSDEFIGRVQLGGIDNSTGASSGGYGDFTTISTSLSKDDSYSITITPTWTGTVYVEGYAAWIDYNQDGDFTDSGELLFSQSATNATSVDGSFTVPSSALDGSTRLRVAMKYDGIPSSCESFDFGEVEDYTVTLVAGVADTQAPTVPSNLAASNITSDSFDINWNASTDNVGVTGYNVLLDGVLQGATTNTSYSFNGLSASTSYVATIEAFDNAGNTSAQTDIAVDTDEAVEPGSTVLLSSFFESGWDGWSDGGGDAFRYAGSRSFEGNFSIRLRDNSGTASSMTYAGVDVSSYDAVDIEFYFYPNSMENGEDFWVQFNGGSGWQTVATYVSGTNFQNGNFYVATVSIDASVYNFSANAGFRFRCDASANGDQVYIDQVTVTGITGGTSFASNSVNSLGGLPNSSLSLLEADGIENVSVYPNPVVNKINIEGIPSHAKVQLIDVTGRIIDQSIGQTQFDLSKAIHGVYILQVSYEDEVRTFKIIKN